MSKKTTLERAYVHINNGGISFKIVERVDVRKDNIILPDDWAAQCRTMTNAEREAKLATLPVQDMHNRRWVFHVETRHFGSGVSFSFPLVPVIVKWMIWSLQRVLARMETPQELPTDGLEFGLRDEEMYVGVVDGEDVGHVDWPVPRRRGSGEQSAASQADVDKI